MADAFTGLVRAYVLDPPVVGLEKNQGVKEYENLNCV